MKSVWQQWSFMRLLRMVLAIAILVQGIYAKETIAIVLGVAFGGMALANVGCCGASGCTINTRPSNAKAKVEYEELDIKK